MQAAPCFAPPSLPRYAPSKTLASPLRSIMPSSKKSPLGHRIKTSAVAYEISTVDYESLTTSVFPAEACETIGGDACAFQMYPEARIEPSKSDTKKTSLESVDREYLEYNEPKTVFRAEACDDLGGEFCEPDFLKGD